MDSKHINSFYNEEATDTTQLYAYTQDRNHRFQEIEYIYDQLCRYAKNCYLPIFDQLSLQELCWLLGLEDYEPQPSVCS